MSLIAHIEKDCWPQLQRRRMFRCSTKKIVSKAIFIVIARLDRAIQDTLKILDSRLRGNDGTWGLTYGLLSNYYLPQNSNKSSQ